MSTTNQDLQGVAGALAAEDVCRVAMFYDDTPARERAVTLSHHLVEHFWQELDLSFSWWRFRYLEEPVIAETASMAAVSADVLVFSVTAASLPEAHVLRWLNSWVPHRNEEAGVVVPLLHPSTAEAISDSSWMVEIEEVARQTGLECLLPSEFKRSPLLDESLRQMQVRTRHVGGILGDIMKNTQRFDNRPPGWGLNE
jgi:hypothetical protein